MADFSGRVALITGAGSPSGIGFAAARILGRGGARVAIASTTDRINERVAELEREGITASGHIGDLMADGAPARLIGEVLAATDGHLDILVNNAGMVVVGGPWESSNVLDMDLAEWDQGMARNLGTAFLVTKAALPSLIASGHGRIVYVSSVTGPVVSNPASTVYGAAKAGILGLMRGLAIEVGRQGVTVNAVLPGWIATGSQLQEEVIGGENTPAGRSGTPAEVAEVIFPRLGRGELRDRPGDRRRRRQHDPGVQGPRGGVVLMVDGGVEGVAQPERVALVTGGASGIGAATAERLGRDGVQVVLADIDATGLDRMIARLGGPDRALGVATDVSSFADCERAVAAAVDRFGRLDILVNCAGIWVEGPTDTMTEADWNRVIDVNLKGTFAMCRFAIPALEATGGCIVNVSSDAGLWGGKGAAIYCASKGGVTILSKSLAVELAERGIRVNAVCPGDVDSPMIAYQAATFGGGDPDGYLRGLLSAYPQKPPRFIRPDEGAELIAFLASERATPITGAAISIDFGLTAGY